MNTRRHFLHVTAGGVFAVALCEMAHAADAPKPQQLVGRWKVSAVQQASGSSEGATLSKMSDGSLSLTADGDTAKLLGGPVKLAAQSDGSFIGRARTGVAAAISVVDENSLSFTLKGNGVYFSLFLLK